MTSYKCRAVNGNQAHGEVTATCEPISFLGGVDADTGIVREKGHELFGKCIKDKILAFPKGKGSTVGSYVIYALKKKGTAPIAIINKEAEPIIVVGAIISDIPLFEFDFIDKIKSGDRVSIEGDTITLL